MQLPTSTIFTGQPSPSQNRPANSASSAKPVNEPVKSTPEIDTQSAPTSTASAGPGSNADQQKDASSLELKASDQVQPTFETPSVSTGNSSTDSYQQIAKQGEQDAAAQDPSLFRVDVYV